MDNCEAQSDEILALASIYDSTAFTAVEENGIRGGQFVANLQLPESFQVICKLPDDDKPAKIHHVEHLPPLTLNFQLPLDYPLISPPHFTLSCKWLSREQLSKLCTQLDKIWEENKGEVVLFHWFQFLSDETLRFLGINDQLDVSFCNFTKPTRRSLQEKVKTTLKDESWNTADKDNLLDDEPKQPGDRKFRNPREKSVEYYRRPYNKGRSGACNTRPFRKYSTDHKFASKSKSREFDLSCEASTKQSQGNCLRQLPSVKQYSDFRAVQDLPPGTLLLPIILDYDQQRRQQVFNSSIFSCNICFDEKIGSQCLAFKTCNHVFCRSCLQSYFEVQINSGNVQKLNCPEEKCPSQALPTQVRELVAPELFAKYDRLLLSSTLDTMTDIVYCPRHSCQCAVLVEPNSTMANCPACFHAFCILCKMAYHGVVPCRIKSGDFQTLCDEYLKSSDEDKRLLEKRYGRSQLQQIVNNVLSEEWVQTNSKRCPSCNTPIEKRDGCNKMTCFRCDCYFCWLCMNRLNKADPYDHYNNPSSPCVNLLFRGVDMNDSEGEEEIGEFL